MDMHIDDIKPTTQVSSTLTMTHSEVSSLEQETNWQKQMITGMEQQIQILKKSVQELVEYKAQEEAAKKKYSQWQQVVTESLEVVGGDAQDTK